MWDPFVCLAGVSESCLYAGQLVSCPLWVIMGGPVGMLPALGGAASGASGHPFMLRRLSAVCGLVFCWFSWAACWTFRFGAATLDRTHPNTNTQWGGPTLAVLHQAYPIHFVNDNLI